MVLDFNCTSVNSKGSDPGLRRASAAANCLVADEDSDQILAIPPIPSYLLTKA